MWCLCLSSVSCLPRQQCCTLLVNLLNHVFSYLLVIQTCVSHVDQKQDATVLIIQEISMLTLALHRTNFFNVLIDLIAVFESVVRSFVIFFISFILDRTWCDAVIHRLGFQLIKMLFLSSMKIASIVQFKQEIWSKKLQLEQCGCWCYMKKSVNSTSTSLCVILHGFGIQQQSVGLHWLSYVCCEGFLFFVVFWAVVWFF